MVQTTHWMRAALVFAITGLFLSGSPKTYAQADDSARARVNYILQCQGCHRADGRGATQSTPDLLTDGRLFLGSPEGRAFFVSVPGVANAPLSDEELTGVINYTIRNLIMKGDRFESLLYTVSELSQYRRAKTDQDIVARRREVIERLKQNQ